MGFGGIASIHIYSLHLDFRLSLGPLPPGDDSQNDLLLMVNDNCINYNTGCMMLLCSRIYVL